MYDPDKNEEDRLAKRIELNVDGKAHTIKRILICRFSMPCATTSV
jgi:hypothetical protein